MSMSKELLSEVLGVKIKDIYKLGSNPNFGNNEVLYSVVGNGDLCNINIHELAHKCKEWARKKGYILLTCPYEIYNQYCGNEDDFSYYTCYVNISEHENGIDYDYEFEAETENEAIFKACNYIINELSN